MDETCCSKHNQANKVLDIFMISKKNKAKAFHSALNIEMRGFLEWNSSNTWNKLAGKCYFIWELTVLQKGLYLTLF